MEFFTHFPFSENALHFSVLKTTFVLVIIFSGVIWNLRKRPALNIVDLFFIYLITLVAFSSSVGNQYFAIPLISVAHYYKKVSFWMYSLTAALWITINRHGAFCDVFSGIKEEIPTVAGFEYYYAQVWLVVLLGGIWWGSRVRGEPGTIPLR